MADPIQLVTVTITTALTGTPESAKQSALEALEFEDLTFGAPGKMLPFQLENIETRVITDEEIGRG